MTSWSDALEAVRAEIQEAQEKKEERDEALDELLKELYPNEANSKVIQDFAKANSWEEFKKGE